MQIPRMPCTTFVRISIGGSDDLVLIPWLFTDPSEPYAGICSNIDGGSDGLVPIPWLFTNPSEPCAGICSNLDGGSDGLVMMPS